MTRRYVIRRPWFFAVVLAMVCAPASASDAYIVYFQSFGPQKYCWKPRWRNTLLLYNDNDAPVTVSVLGVSNGPLRPGSPATFLVSPRVIQSVATEPVLTDPETAVWVVHYDIPPGVTAENRAEIRTYDNCDPGLSHVQADAKISLPIFRELVPAGQKQIVVGTDIGVRQGRENVLVYNGGDNAATAVIEVRRACDNALVDSRAMQIPPNTIQQELWLTTGSSDGCKPAAFYEVRYTTITVDQPSFALVSTLKVTQDRPLYDFTPLIEAAVAHNTRF